MTRSERAKLRHELSRLIARRLASGDRVTTSEIYQAARIELPSLLDEAQERMMREYVQNMARSVMKDAMRGKTANPQASLFTDEMKRIQVPRCIALPAPGPGREMMWTSTFDASLNELSQHIRFLKVGAAADMARAQRLQAFHDYVLRVASGDDPDRPIKELLAELQSGAA